MDQILYCVFAAVALLAALLSVTRKNAVAAACWLVIMFFGLAAIFVLMEAYFVAAVQILVYAGAIMVLFLFVIMLLDLRSEELKAHAGPSLKLVGVLLAGVFFGAVVYAVSDAAAAGSKVADRVSAVLRFPAPPPPTPSDDPTKPTPPAQPAPAPVAIILTEDASKANPESRTYVGSIPVVPGGPGIAAPVEIVVPSSGEPRVTPGGAPIGTTWKPGTATGSLTATSEILYDVGEPTRGEPVSRPAKSAVIEWTVQRGGLDASASAGPDGSPRAIGKSLFEKWLLPFEITSLLLTGAIFGAVVLTKREALVNVLAAIAPNAVLYLAAALFSVGLVGVACRRNILVMLLSVEIMINAANLAFVAFSKVHGDVDGQVFVFFAMTVAAAEVAVGLAIVIAVYRLRKDVDADVARDLTETEVGAVPPITPEGPGGHAPHLREMDDRASTLDDGHGHGAAEDRTGHGRGHGRGRGSEEQGHAAAPAEAESH